MNETRAHESFEKCRALLKALDATDLDKVDKQTLVICAMDYLEDLGEATGITATQRP